MHTLRLPVFGPPPAQQSGAHSPAIQLVDASILANESHEVQVHLLLSAGRRRVPLLRRRLQSKPRRALTLAGWAGIGFWDGSGMRAAAAVASRSTGAAEQEHCTALFVPTWWMESMSGAPSGGCSRYAPRSAGDMPSVVPKNCCRKEPSAAGRGGEGGGGGPIHGKPWLMSMRGVPHECIASMQCRIQLLPGQCQAHQCPAHLGCWRRHAAGRWCRRRCRWSASCRTQRG